jgi:uncharacterized protein
MSHNSYRRRHTAVSLSIGLAALLLGAFIACSKSGSSTHPTTTTGASGDSILLNIGNNIILPSYQNLEAATASLDSAITDFNGSPNATRLSNTQALFKTAYITWQTVSAYNYFGPAYSAQPVLATLNVFPTNDTLIEANITAGSDNVSTFANTAAKGFPALDYLLFGAGTNLLTDYTTDPAAANRRHYLAAVSADMVTEVSTALTAWSASGGDYIKTFIDGSGNSVSSSLGLLINSIDEDFEILKNDRLGIPLGLIPVGVTSPVLPKEVEARYSGISAQLALSQAKAIQGLYLGTGANGNGLGLIDYLINANAKYNGGPLSDTVKAAFTLEITDLQAISDPLSQTILTNPAPAQAAFNQSQKLVALLKTDMPSSLGVLITYGDNDGD